MFYCCYVRGLLALPLAFDGMVSCGIRKHFPVSLHRPVLRATNFLKPLKPLLNIAFVFALHEQRAPVISFRIIQKYKFSLANNGCIFPEGVSLFLRLGSTTLTNPRSGQKCAENQRVAVYEAHLACFVRSERVQWSR